MAPCDGLGRITTRWEALSAEALTDPWARLVQADPQATVFSTPLFQRALFASFGPPDPHAVVLEQAGQIVGLMPVAPLALRRGPLTLHEAGFLRCAHTLRNTLLVPRGDIALKALLAALLRDLRGDSLLFQNLPVDGEVLDRLRAAATAMGLHSDAPQPGRVLMFADLDGGYDAFLSTRSGHLRRQLRKRYRDLRAAGEMRIKRLTGAEISGAMADWRKIVASSWQGQSVDSVGNTAQDWDFHHRLAGNGALFILYLDGRPVACLRQLEHDGIAFLHTMNYDSALRNMAPGMVVFDRVMNDNAARGIRRMDFNGRSDFYARWATGETHHRSLRLYRNSLRGHAARHIRARLYKIGDY